MTSSGPSSNYPKARNLLVLLTCALLVGGASLYLYSVQSRAAHKVLLHNPDGSQVTIDLSPLEGMSLLNLKTGRTEHVSYGAAHTLLVFMSPGDCPACLTEQRVWDELAQTHDSAQLQVVGILVRTSLAEARAFAKGYPSSFTLYVDVNEQLKHSAALPPTTPFKALVDHEGKVLLAEGPNADPAQHRNFSQHVLARLNSMPATP
jgi:peroxiredoxin